MNFSIEFFWHSLRAAVFAVFFFGLPGLWTALLLGWRFNPSVLLVVPALGLCAYGSFSLLFTWLLGYSSLTVSAAWLLYQGIAVLVYINYVRRITPDSPDNHSLVTFSSVPHVLWLSLVAAIWALLPTINIYPAVYQEGLFVNGHIFDHMKIAFIDGITREGLPLMNPFYAPGGERIPLIYYYAWHFLGAQIKTLSCVSGWQAEVALSWLTSFSIVSFLAALAVRISGRLWAGFALLLFALIGQPADVLPRILGARWGNWVGYPPIHPVEVLWIQLSWAPQHVFAALCSVLLLFLTARAIFMPHLCWCYAGIIGLIAAVGFGASVWVGGVALLLVLFPLLFTLWYSRLELKHWWGPLLLALGVCVVFAWPVLSSVASGPSLAVGFPLAFKLFHATKLFGVDAPLHLVANIVLFWLQFLPLCFGIVYVLGIFTVTVYKSHEQETQLFKYLSIVVIVADLLAVQWVQSVVVNNDFGWRTAVVPFMLLLVWAAVALADLPRVFMQWRSGSLMLHARPVVIPLIWIGITVGMAASFYVWVWPQPHPLYRSPSKKDLTWHRDFFRQREAWAAVRRYTGPNDLVQNNPDTYATVVTPWPAPAPVSLFADRPVAYTDPESVNVFAHSYSKAQKSAQEKAVHALFVTQPEPAALLYARDTLRIKALLVDLRDPVWHSQAIEHSGIYRLVEETQQFKVYLADYRKE